MTDVEGWYRVQLPHYVCAFELDADGKIVECAPIMRWAKGKHISAYAAWARRKGGTFLPLGP